MDQGITMTFGQGNAILAADFIGIIGLTATLKQDPNTMPGRIDQLLIVVEIGSFLVFIEREVCDGFKVPKLS